MACRNAPTWLHAIGLIRTEDLGNGMGVSLIWQEAIPTQSNTTIHYNIYVATNRLDVLDSNPVAITKELSAIINIPPGDVHFFNVRATEFNTTEYDITELIQIGQNLYQYPSELILLNDLPDAYGTTIEVEDTTDYPSKGFLLIGTEVLQYSEKTPTTFIVTDSQRGAFQTEISNHETGEIVRLFDGIEEGNSVIHQGTAAWYFVNPRNLDELGEYNVAEDGYRENKEDILTTDMSASDESNADFPPYDTCGYHRPSITESFTGECVGSYLGGDFNGSRGFDLQDRLTGQLDTMLQATGEPVILLRRRQTGRRCRCGQSDLRREHPNARCQFCFGTGFEQGYFRVFNTRAISELFVNTMGAINIRVSPYDDDVKLEAANGIRQIDELVAWTLVVPTLKDRDVLVRFNEDFTEEFRYEVLKVNRNKTFFSKSGKQNFNMQRLDKTSIIYSYNISDTSRFITI